MRTVALTMALVTMALGQTEPKFDVASVKATSSTGSLTVNFPPGGRFSCRNLTVRNLMRSAYGVQDYQIVGAPAWVDSAGFDIEAKAADGAGEVSHEQVLRMIRGLLEERFQLAVHRETRQLPVYNLVVGKNGATLNAAASDAPVNGTIRMGKVETPKMSMTGLANLLVYEVNRPVIDGTGLKGDFAFTLEYTRGLSESDAGTAERPSLFTAVQEQLGLKLESGKGPVPVVVIDRVEKPSAN